MGSGVYELIMVSIFGLDCAVPLTSYGVSAGRCVLSWMRGLGSRDDFI